MAKAHNQKSLKVTEKTKPGVPQTDLELGKLPTPPEITSVADIKRELARIYRLVWQGKLHVSEASRLSFMLDRITQAIKTEAEITALQEGYAGAWAGVSFIGVPQPRGKVIDHDPND